LSSCALFFKNKELISMISSLRFESFCNTPYKNEVDYRMNASANKILSARSFVLENMQKTLLENIASSNHRPILKKSRPRHLCKNMDAKYPPKNISL